MQMQCVANVERQSDLQFAKPGWLHFNNSIHYLISDYKRCSNDERRVSSEVVGRRTRGNQKTHTTEEKNRSHTKKPPTIVTQKRNKPVTGN